MIEEVDLPEEIFEGNKFTGIKWKNFFYGKNGTGKSSLTQAIMNQYSLDYDLRVFKGF
ncbi:MAG: hypothetical protein L0L22_14080 [Staphylococcus equorum]|nr:hypothetical protein [Tetragenococcus koreensis]MDN6572112.1 hypothetical protein [Staphylococcus equorum]